MNSPETLLVEHGIKPSASRILVLKAIMEADHPLSMAEIECVLESVDKSQISRALNLFMESDLLHKIDDGTGTAHYELCHSHSEDGEDDDEHIHFYCEKCHRLFCLEELGVPTVAVPEGYHVHHSSFILHGTCPDCS